MLIWEPGRVCRTLVAGGVGATAGLALLRNEAYDSRQRKRGKDSRENPGGSACRHYILNSPPRESGPQVRAGQVRVPTGDAERVLEGGHPKEGVADQGREAAGVVVRGREVQLPSQLLYFLQKTYRAVVERRDVVVHGSGLEGQSREEQTMRLREHL